MQTDQEINTLVKTIIETRVIEGLKSAPEAIDALVKAAISQPVDRSGNFQGYGDKMPFLEYLTGQMIREAASVAVSKVIQEMQPTIEGNVRKWLTQDRVAEAMTIAFVKASADAWRINVSFEREETR